MIDIGRQREGLGDALAIKNGTVICQRREAIYRYRKVVRRVTCRPRLDRVWWLLMSAALLGVMARAFKWI